MKTYNLGSNVLAFSTYRQGGVSMGTYASMNANAFCGDTEEHVKANRVILSKSLGISPDSLVIPHQVHGTRVEYVTRIPSEFEETDALITDRDGICICVSTADCIPVLLYDPGHHAVAAIHAGWRGTVAGIVRCTIEAMEQRFHSEPREIKAVIGPGIGPEAFEVGDEVWQAFHDRGFPMERISLRRDKWHIDLWQANRWLLEQCGVCDIHVCGECTYTLHERYFSARRLGTKSGRILNGIMLKP